MFYDLPSFIVIIVCITDSGIIPSHSQFHDQFNYLLLFINTDNILNSKVHLNATWCRFWKVQVAVIIMHFAQKCSAKF